MQAEHGLTTCIAFEGKVRLAEGELVDVAAAVRHRLDQDDLAQVLVFDGQTSRVIDLDLRGSVQNVRDRITSGSGTAEATGQSDNPETTRRPGRPKLGVVAREITLLPRHWEWLAAQPGGASVALRKLVEAARRDQGGSNRVRLARESCYRFMQAMAGDEPGFEEASRALFAGNETGFRESVSPWPADVAAHARRLAAPSFTEEVVA